MRRSIIALVLGVFALIAAATAGAAGQSAQEPAKPPAPPQKYQLVLFKLGPAWQKDKPIPQQPGIQEHAAYMSKLVKEGMLVLGGPLLDEKTKTFTGAMMVLAVATAEEAGRVLEIDPAHTSGLLEIDKIESLIITGASWRPAAK